MSNLRICNAVSLHPDAKVGSEPPSHSLEQQPLTRFCVLGCRASKAELSRFPVHDESRCNSWLRHFGVSEQLVQELGGLQKLRVCFRHFNQQAKAMAKTRIKTTPLRLAKAAAMGHTNTGSVDDDEDSTTIELVDNCSSGARKQLKLPSEPSVTTISTVPQRSHSICSSASSDVQSISSDYEGSLPLSTVFHSNRNTDANSNSNVSTNANSNGVKKRKLYLITEKPGEGNGATAGLPGQPAKRKMFVVVEQEKDTAPKKLTIFKDKPQGHNLAQHLEKFLPEILSCIQDKEAKQNATPSSHLAQQALPQKLPNAGSVGLDKPHITLPPKKNPTNFVRVKPVLAGATPLFPAPTPNSLPKTALAEVVTPHPTEEGKAAVKQNDNGETNINLSPDFRFLMKILPKLEQLPEPHKQNVKRSIQIFVEKSYSIYTNALED